MKPVMTLGDFVDVQHAGLNPQLWISTLPQVYRVDSVAWDPDGPVDSLPRVLVRTEGDHATLLRLHLSTPLFASAAEAHQEQDDDNLRRGRRRQGLPRW